MVPVETRSVAVFSRTQSVTVLQHVNAFAIGNRLSFRRWSSDRVCPHNQTVAYERVSGRVVKAQTERRDHGQTIESDERCRHRLNFSYSKLSRLHFRVFRERHRRLDVQHARDVSD